MTLGGPVCLALALAAGAVNAQWNDGHAFKQQTRRSLTTSPSDLSGQTFDFVIAGGGVAGLALAARLAEWSNVTVAVIEAGGDGSEFEDRIDVPGYSYIDGLTYTAYDWGYDTTVQTDAGNATKYWPRGKGLGGSGAINGMFWRVASAQEYDAWNDLNPGGAEDWGWSEVSKYIMKSENLTLPTADQTSTFGIAADASAHGSGGPIQTGFCEYIFDFVAHWIPTWETLNFKAIDGQGGSTHGVFMTAMTLNARNQSRSDSKAGYIDPFPRSNLKILTGYQVTGIQWNSTTSGSAVAGGLTFKAADGTGSSYTVYAGKEVILSGGVIGSAQILQLSGVGPSGTLTPLGIDVVSDIPVGYNLQDHASATMYFNTVSGTTTWSALRDSFVGTTSTNLSNTALTEWKDSGTGLLTYVNQAVGYPSFADINSDYATYAASAASALTTNTNNMIDWYSGDVPSSVSAGLKAQYNITNTWLSTDVGQLEIILTMLGPAQTTQIGIQVAIQHPYSRGTVLINSTSAFNKPVINPGYFGQDYDSDIFQYGATWARTLAATAPLSNYLAGEVTPGTAYTGSTLGSYMVNKSETEYHPLGTCSMLPQASGGVVDTTLMVYGTTNLRVVDASIIPLHLSAHLMATSYGIAEKAADIIKSKWAAKILASTTSSSTTATATTGTSASTSASAGLGSAATTGNLTSITTGAKAGIIVGVVGAAAIALGLLIFFLVRKRNKKSAEKAAAAASWYAAGQNDDDWAPESKPPVRADSSMRLNPMGQGPSSEALSAPPVVFGQHYKRQSVQSMESYGTAEMAAGNPMSHSNSFGPNYDSGYSPHPISPYQDSPELQSPDSGRRVLSPQQGYNYSPQPGQQPPVGGYGQPGSYFTPH